MDKQQIAAFFDRCAPHWDSDMVRDEAVIASILDNAGIRAGVDVLDVACGTGVLFPDYRKRNVASVTGIDLSPEMVKIASSKFPDVTVVCGDIEQTRFARKFDCVMVYNAFPHFPNPERLIETLSALVKTGGRLSVAHGMGKAAIDAHHKHAAAVSIELIDAQALATIFGRWFDVDTVISTEQMYQVCGVLRES